MNRFKKLGRQFDNVGRNYALQKGVYGQSFTGQLGKAVVGGTWKDKKTLRTYAIPTNPNTVAQVAQREKFKISQVAASSLLATVVQPYWNPFANSQSGFNAFIGANSQLVTDNEDFLNLLCVKGSYEAPASLTSATYNTADGATELFWSTTVQNIGSADDQSLLILLNKTDYDPTQKTPVLLSNFKVGANRSVGQDSFDIATGLTPSDLYFYLAFKQPAASSILRVSNSLSKVCAAA